MQALYQIFTSCLFSTLDINLFIHSFIWGRSQEHSGATKDSEQDTSLNFKQHMKKQSLKRFYPQIH